MSSFNYLYKKYETVSNLTNELNDSVIIIKRRKYADRQADLAVGAQFNVSNEEYQKANAQIKSVLTKFDDIELEQEERLQEIFDEKVELVREESTNDLEKHRTDIVEKISKNENLSDQDLTHIDEFISVLDNQASELFKKLRTPEDE